MWLLRVVVLASVAVSQAYYFNTIPHQKKHDKKEGVMLTCDEIRRGGTFNNVRIVSITAAIRMKKKRPKSRRPKAGNTYYRYGHVDFANRFSTATNYGVTGTHGHGGRQEDDHHLEADFGFTVSFLIAPPSFPLTSLTSGTYKIIVTERGAIPDDPGTVSFKFPTSSSERILSKEIVCDPNLLGPGVKVADTDHVHRNSVHLYPSYSINRYGYPDVFFGRPDSFYRRTDHTQRDPDGVIGEIELLSSTPGARDVTVKGMKPFTKLDQLAGRGIIACIEADVYEDADGRAVCNTGTDDVIICCNLAYEKDTD